MNAPSEDPRALLIAYLDNDLDADGIAQLDAAIKEDPAFRRDAATIIVQELHLFEIGRRLALQGAAVAELPSAPPLSSRLRTGLERAMGLARCPWAWGLAGAAAAVVVLGFLLVSWASPYPRLASVNGRVTLERDGRVRPATTGGELRPGDRVRLATNAFVELGYRREQTLLRFWSGAELAVPAGKTAAKFLTLEHGQMAATIAPQPPGNPMRVSTPHGSATVIGTEFNLIVSDEVTRLEVWQGKVRLADRSGQQTLDVLKGEFGQVSTFAPPAGGVVRQGVTRECWLGQAAGVRPLAELPCLAQRPDYVETLSNLSAPPNWNDAYVGRLSGWLRPEISGWYEFWIVGDDRAEFWLSSDETREAKARICWTSEWTGMEDWEQSLTQKSARVRLQAGRKYYLEALQYDLVGGDFVKVAWQGPDGQRQVIPGLNLIATDLPKPASAVGRKP